AHAAAAGTGRFLHGKKPAKATPPRHALRAATQSSSFATAFQDLCRMASVFADYCNTQTISIIELQVRSRKTEEIFCPLERTVPIATDEERTAPNRYGRFVVTAGASN